MTVNGKRFVDAEERRLAASDLNTTYMVEAAAGTGKTTILVERIMSILRTGTPPERLVAITFTERAAAELATRVRAKLEEELSKARSDIEQKTLDAAVTHVTRANISTIHSFAGAILREYPIEAEIDPRYAQLDEMGSDLLLFEVWEEWTDETFSGSTAPPALLDAYTTGVNFRDLEKAARRVVEYRDLNVSAAGTPDGDEMNCDYWAGRLGSVVRDAEDACKDKNDGLHVMLLSYANSLRKAKGSSGPEFVYRITGEKFNSPSRKGRKENWNDINVFRQRAAVFRDDLERAVASYKKRLTTGAVEELRKGFLRRYEEEKAARGLLDFFDLLLKTRNLLVKHRRARGELQNRFDYILVDEFQDTDPLQTEIVFLLAGNDAATADWREVRPEPGKLFLVGDPKQSIYRFRRADIGTYRAARRIIESSPGARVLEIKQNFRNVPVICRWVNAAFEKIFAGQANQARYIPIEPTRGTPPGNAPSVIFLKPDDDYVKEHGRDYIINPEKIPVDAYRQAEAYSIASLISTAVAGRWQVEGKYPDGEPDTRPIRYGDFAVLLANLEGAWDIYKKVFDDFNLPYRVSGGKHYFTRLEIRELAAVLRAVANPADGAATVAALRSPFFGAGDGDIYRQSRVGGFDYTTRGPGEPKTIADAFDLLHDLNKSATDKVSDTIERLYEKTTQLSLRLYSGERQQAANLLKALDLARAYEEETTATLYGFAAWLAEREPNADEPDAETAAGDFLEVTSIHKAKGLEFPAVVIANLIHRINLNTDVIWDREKNAFDLKINNSFETYNYEQHLEDEKIARRAEISRVNYVAATRARDYLIVPLFGTRATEKTETYFADFEYISDDVHVVNPAEVPPPEPAGRYDASTAFELFEEEKKLTERVKTSLSVSKGDDKFVVPSADDEYETERRADGRACPDGKGNDPRSIGKAFHEIMETIKPTDPGDINDVVARKAADFGVAAAAGELAAMVRYCLTCETLKRALTADRYFRELPFVWRYNGKLVEGVVDLAFENANGLVIVDYKTDRITGDASGYASRYLPQLRWYAAALEGTTGKPVVEAIIVFAAAGREVIFNREGLGGFGTTTY